MSKHKILATLGGGLLLLTSSALAATLEQRVGQLEKDIDEMNERGDANELAATLNKVKFGLEFNTSVHNITSKTGGVTNDYYNRWMMGLYLNMNADINQYTKFTGRLSMTKAFGDLEVGLPYAIGSLDAGRGASGGSSIYVERAYVDIYMGRYAALTMGRLPGTDGPGSNLRNGSARMSTYPALAVNALGDGVVLTLKPYTNSALRVGYSKVYQSFDTNGNSTAGSIFGSGAANTADANLFFGAFETPFLPSNFGKNLFMLTYINLTNYTAPGALLTAAANAYLAQMGQPTNASVGSSNLGDMQYINAHFENDRLLGSGLNWFVSASYYIGTKSHNVNASVTNGTTTTNQSLGNPFFAERDGWAVHAGLRYDFGLYFKIGYEYFKGSKNWYAFSRVSINDPFNFRNTRGDVHDVYAIWQLDLNQFFRLSYTRQHQQYATATAPMITPATNVVNQNISLAYILRF